MSVLMISDTTEYGLKARARAANCRLFGIQPNQRKKGYTAMIELPRDRQAADKVCEALNMIHPADRQAI